MMTRLEIAYELFGLACLFGMWLAYWVVLP